MYKIIHVQDSNKPLIITEGGTETGWAIYVGGTIDVQGYPCPLYILADYVLVTGVTFRGFTDKTCYVAPGLDHVKIEQCAFDGYDLMSVLRHDIGTSTNTDSPPTLRIPLCCPVCEGRGQVPAGFYLEPISDKPVPCRACGGTGIVWG